MAEAPSCCGHLRGEIDVAQLGEKCIHTRVGTLWGARVELGEHDGADTQLVVGGQECFHPSGCWLDRALTLDEDG